MANDLQNHPGRSIVESLYGPQADAADRALGLGSRRRAGARRDSAVVEELREAPRSGGNAQQRAQRRSWERRQGAATERREEALRQARTGEVPYQEQRFEQQVASPSETAARMGEAVTTGVSAAQGASETWGRTAGRFVENLDDRFGRVLGNIVQAVPEMRRQMMGAAEAATGMPGIGRFIDFAASRWTAPIDEETRRVGRGLSERASAELQRNALPEGASFAQHVLYDSLNGFVDLGLAIGATAATRSPTVGASVIAAQAFGDRFGTSIE